MSNTRRRLPKCAVRDPGVLCEAYEYAKPVSFSRGLRVRMGECDMLFISGTASVDERGQTAHVGDFDGQARRAFSNIKALIESEGADWHDVVKTTCYLTDFRHYDRFNAIRNAFYSREGLNPLPASTCVQAGLCRPELLVEIDALAIIPASRPIPSRTGRRPAGKRPSAAVRRSSRRS